MIRSDHIDHHGEHLLATFPTRFFVTAEGAMASSSMEISGSSTVYVMPSGVFTWTNDGGSWLHPDDGRRYPLSDFHEPELDEDGDVALDAKLPTAVAERMTDDDPFAHDNVGPWMSLDGDEIPTSVVAAQPRPWISSGR